MEYGGVAWTSILSFQDLRRKLRCCLAKYALAERCSLPASDTGRARDRKCVGVRPFDRPAACEMKRLYVRPAGRGNAPDAHFAVEAIRFASGLVNGEMLLTPCEYGGSDPDLPSRSVSNRYRRTGITPFRHSF